MDIEKLIERLGENTDCWTDKVHGYADLRLEASITLSTLQAENEKLRAELEQVKSEKAVALEHQGHNATWYDIGASGAHCSRCHYRATQQSRYCPHCGAKMERREKP